jgi:hypothetical protein
MCGHIVKLMTFVKWQSDMSKYIEKHENQICTNISSTAPVALLFVRFHDTSISRLPYLLALTWQHMSLTVARVCSSNKCVPGPSQADPTA